MIKKTISTILVTLLLASVAIAGPCGKALDTCNSKAQDNEDLLVCFEDWVDCRMELE